MRINRRSASAVLLATAALVWNATGATALAASGGYESAVRFDVDPTATEVFVDGYYVGIVDSYDGIFQRLRLPPGDHEIELFLEGHASVRQTIHLVRGDTYRIRYEMQPLAAGAPPPSRPRPDPRPIETGAPAAGSAIGPRAASAVFGTLIVRMRPLDADVLIDGEPWVGHEGTGELVLDLGAGIHDVEVRRSGHRAYRTAVEVVAGEETAINVSLPRAGGS